MTFINLSPTQISTLFLALGILLLSAFVFGKIFSFFKTPKVIGEIFGGFILGYSGVYLFAPDFITSLFNGFEAQSQILNVFYQLGLIFLMFMAGFNTQINFEKANLKIISVLFMGATFLPAFAGFFFIDFFKDEFIGEKGNDTSFSLVFLIAIAVTSIPVISKIFFDIGIIKTRFASIILTTSTIQDLFLWILLNIAINSSLNKTSLFDNLYTAVITIVLFLGVKILAHLLSKVKINLGSVDFFTLAFILLFLSIALFNTVHINPMYTSFLIGFLVKNIIDNHDELKTKISGISDFAFSYFIPIYFALIGIQLNIIHEFSFLLFIAFCSLACVFEFLGVYLSLFTLRLSNIAKANFAIAMNARGGPGIVLASTSFYYHIINTNFFTTLILTTLLSSAFAGYYLRWNKNKYGDEIFTNFNNAKEKQ